MESYILTDKLEYEPCEMCGGTGRRSYGSTAAWRGGAGGQMITVSTCDKCWGTGDGKNPGTDLRKIKNG